MPHARAVVVTFVSTLTALVVAAPGCVSDAPGGSDASVDGSSTTGKYKGPCFPNDTCDKGLVCVQGAVCLMPGEEAGAPDAGDAGGDGDDDAPMCKAPGATCGQGDCCAQGLSCLPSGSSPKCCVKGPTATACKSDDECCDFMGKQMHCNGGTRCCVLLGGSCSQGSDCCDLNSACTGNTCCTVTSKPCQTNSDCCSNNCNGTYCN